MDDLRLEEAHKELEELQRQMTTYRRAYSEKYIKANGIAIECIERVTELEKENAELRKQLEDAKHLKRVKVLHKLRCGKEYRSDGVLDEGKQLLFIGHCSKRIAKDMNIEWREEDG